MHEQKCTLAAADAIQSCCRETTARARASQCDVPDHRSPHAHGTELQRQYSAACGCAAILETPGGKQYKGIAKSDRSRTCQQDPPRYFSFFNAAIAFD